MSDILATIELPSTGVDPDDGCVQSYALHREGAVTTPQLVSATQALVDFISTTPTGGTNAPGRYLASYLNHATNGALISFYDITGALDGSPHGSPISTATFTLPTALDSSCLAPQVAVAVTHRGRNALISPVETVDGADAGSARDRPRQRHTGRTFWGPLSAAAVTAGATVPARPAQAFIDELMRGYEDLQDDLNAAGWVWSVWSRSDQAMYGVTSVECDNSFDVIRARKVAATGRSTRVFSPVPSIALGA